MRQARPPQEVSAALSLRLVHACVGLAEQVGGIVAADRAVAHRCRHGDGRVVEVEGLCGGLAESGGCVSASVMTSARVVAVRSKTSSVIGAPSVLATVRWAVCRRRTVPTSRPSPVSITSAARRWPCRTSGRTRSPPGDLCLGRLGQGVSKRYTIKAGEWRLDRLLDDVPGPVTTATTVVPAANSPAVAIENSANSILPT